jgi:hypothetical protein
MPLIGSTHEPVERLRRRLLQTSLAVLEAAPQAALRIGIALQQAALQDIRSELRSKKGRQDIALDGLGPIQTCSAAFQNQRTACCMSCTRNIHPRLNCARRHEHALTACTTWSRPAPMRDRDLQRDGTNALLLLRPANQRALTFRTNHSPKVPAMCHVLSGSTCQVCSEHPGPRPRRLLRMPPAIDRSSTPIPCGPPLRT